MTMPSAPTRTRWVDIAKGMAIVLVALYHAGLFLTAADLADDVWLDINEVFRVFRMPLFFFASGLFALSVIRRPWVSMWSSRLALLVWAFLLWSVVRFGFFTIVDSPLPLDETAVKRLVIAPLWPQTGLWFLHALVVFFIGTKLLDVLRVPVWVQVAAATAVSLPFFAGADIGNISYDGMFQYFVFFVVACHFRSTIIPSVQRRGLRSTVVAVLVFAGGYSAAASFGLQKVPGIMFLLAVSALVAGLLIARSIDRVDRLARPAQWIGRQTLPIYVAHVIIIGAITGLLLPLADTAALDALRPVLPILVMVTAVCASLMLWLLVRSRPVVRYLYEAPPLARTPQRLRTRHSAQPAIPNATTDSRSDSVTP
ncbi:acyltransferase family protein [Gordonia sp. NPDC003424]